MTHSQIFTASLVQLRSTREIPPNMAQAEQLIRAAAAQGADYVLTPENTMLMELDKDRLFARVEDEPSHLPLLRFRALAKELGVWLHLGSLAVKITPDKIANRSYLLAPSGDVASRYDKIHMFDVDLPGGESYRESEHFKPGQAAILADLPWGRLGMSICYDLRFPHLYRSLAKAGADFLAVPAAFTRQTGEAHWHILLRARAIETGCFVFAAAQGGRHETGRETYGHSLIIGPWGDILAEAGDEPGIITAKIDPSEISRARERIPALRHDRPFEAASLARLKDSQH